MGDTASVESRTVIDAADQLLDIQRSFELDSAGKVLHLEVGPDRITIAVIEP